MLNVTNEFTPRALGHPSQSGWKSIEVIDVFSNLSTLRGPTLASRPDLACSGEAARINSQSSEVTFTIQHPKSSRLLAPSHQTSWRSSRDAALTPASVERHSEPHVDAAVRRPFRNRTIMDV